VIHDLVEFLFLRLSFVPAPPGLRVRPELSAWISL